MTGRRSDQAAAPGEEAAGGPPGPHAASAEVRAQFGDIDIYLFDQIQRGRFDHRPRLLDAGCGAGRNLPFFLQHRFHVAAVDADPSAAAAVRRLATAHGLDAATMDMRTGPLEALPWPDHSFDAVVCSAVLHFATGEEQFGAMLRELWRVLAPRGLFFARLASSIGLEGRLPATRGVMRLPDGSQRFVVDEALLLQWSSRLGGTLLDPLKTTNVQNTRGMTTWVLEK